MKNGIIMDKKILKMAVDVMRELSLTEICIKDGETQIVMKRESVPVSAPAKFSEPAAADFESAVLQPEYTADNRIDITAPLIGVFYASPSPSDMPFVQIGSRVKRGDMLCIIESMKMMNEIPAECDGTIVDICVSDGAFVEYGQTLFRISADS